jgi:hypothetical protein
VRTQLAAREAELQACLARSEATGPAGLALQALLDDQGVKGKGGAESVGKLRREWLSTQSYAAQRDFGLLAIENIRAPNKSQV